MTYTPGIGSVTRTSPVITPVKRSTRFCDCVGPGVGVGTKPAGDVSVTGTLVTPTVCTPQNRPSIATMFGLTSSVPHVSTSAPVRGTIMPALTVTGLTTGYVLGGAASGSGVLDVQASDANFFLNS